MERVLNFFVVWWWRLIYNVGVSLIKSFWNLQFINSWSIVSTLDDDVNKDSISMPLNTVTSQGFRSVSVHGRLMCCRDGRGAWRTWTLSSREPCSRMTSTRTPSSCRPCRPAVRNLPDHRYVCVSLYVQKLSRESTDSVLKLFNVLTIETLEKIIMCFCTMDYKKKELPRKYYETGQYLGMIRCERGHRLSGVGTHSPPCVVRFPFKKGRRNVILL